MRLPDWTTFKSVVITGKNLNPQYVDYGDRYEIFTDDNEWVVTINKTGGSDQTDFENNYKNTANAPTGAPNSGGAGTITALNGVVTAFAAGIGTVVFNVTGTWVATLTIEGNAGDSTWTAIQGYVPVSQATVSTFTVNQTVVVNCGGFQQVRIRASAYTSGTATVTYNASIGTGVLQVINGAAQNFRVNANLNDGNNNLVTSQASSGQRALDVGVNVAGVQVDPRSIRALTTTDAVAAAPVDGFKQTYTASALNIAPASSPTDVFTITGSATKTVRVMLLSFSATQTTAGLAAVQLIKRSTANSSGTSATATAVPNDSTNAAGTAVVRSYTANPTLGTTVGSVAVRKIFIPGVASVGNEPEQYLYNAGRPSQSIVLRGTGEVLSINLNGVTLTGGSCSYYIEWTEE